MKRVKLSLRIIAFSLTIFLLIPANSYSNTILGESVFPAEEGDEFVWEKVNATEPLYLEVDYIRFTVEQIYNLTDNDKNYLFMNYSLEYYYRYNWVPQYINSFYMAYNKTLNFLNWSSEGFYDGNLFIFPTPINMTLIQESIEVAGYFNTSIEGNKLILDYRNNTIIEHTIETNGISTLIEKITNGTTIFKWKLNTEEVIIRIPLGNSVYIFLIIGINFLIIINLRKFKKKINIKH